MGIFETLKNLQDLSAKIGQAMELKQAVEDLAQEVRALDVSLSGIHKRIRELQNMVKGIAGGKADD